MVGFADSNAYKRYPYDKFPDNLALASFLSVTIGFMTGSLQVGFMSGPPNSHHLTTSNFCLEHNIFILISPENGCITVDEDQLGILLDMTTSCPFLAYLEFSSCMPIACWHESMRLINIV